MLGWTTIADPIQDNQRPAPKAEATVPREDQANQEAQMSRRTVHVVWMDRMLSKRKRRKRQKRVPGKQGRQTHNRNPDRARQKVRKEKQTRKNLKLQRPHRLLDRTRR